MYIAISGNLGSGKTTIAEGLARQFRCECYPKTRYDESYIVDLFQHPDRWTFEAQASFLMHKYNEIRSGLATGKLFILDRTIYEDMEVFARKFYEDGVLAPRSIELLSGIYGDLLQHLEPPALIIWCACPPDVCENRLPQRPRQYQKLYPKDHLVRLDKRLTDWISSVTDIPVLRVDTETVDFRQEGVLHEFAFQVDRFVSDEWQPNQPDLFISASLDYPGSKPEHAPMFDIVNMPARGSNQLPKRLITPRTVYVAAPFTSRARTLKLGSRNGERLFVGDDHIENIAAGYRRQLRQLVHALEGHGYRALLPHRDINAWGHRAYPASEIATKCLDAVAGCDYFVGLIAESFGSHLELGVALGMDKPSLLLVADNIPVSFFGRGLVDSGRVRTLRGRSFSALIKELKRSDILATM
jgi:deoxyadenosine/deoxycytidine kinase